MRTFCFTLGVVSAVLCAIFAVASSLIEESSSALFVPSDMATLAQATGILAVAWMVGAGAYRPSEPPQAPPLPPQQPYQDPRGRQQG